MIRDNFEILDIIEEKITTRFRKMRKVLKARPDMAVFGPDRQWLAQFTEGIGLDICCGDFPIGTEAIGVDQCFLIGSFLGIPHRRADELHFIEDSSMDYIVCNYFDGLANPQYVLSEWKRVLKPKKPVAIVCVNADNYDGPEGPLINKNKLNAFTPRILSNHLHRAGFVDVEVEDVNGMIRAKGNKP